jgi:hypothetical protein
MHIVQEFDFLAEFLAANFQQFEGAAELVRRLE